MASYAPPQTAFDLRPPQTTNNLGRPRFARTRDTMPHLKGISEESTTTTVSGRFSQSLVLDDILDRDSAQSILKRTLSVGTANSTTSSFAERMNACRFTNFDQFHLRDIGRGSCGSVFEVPGTPHAIKKGANTAAIWNDFNLTNHAYNSYLTSLGLFEYAFHDHRVPRVPMARYFNGPNSDDFWTANMTRFPEADRTRAATFHVDRILPVPEPTRQALVRQFFDEDRGTQRAVLANPENKDCLVRVYFGRNNPNMHPYNSTDTLRNFPLYLDQAKMIGIDVDGYAEEMAIGLAILHWKAGIDAQDTEFVIGSSTTKAFATVYLDHESAPPPASTMDDFTQRETQLWMLDYDKCTKFNLGRGVSEKLVEKYLIAVTGNDPYFPHPGLDVGLWQRFRKTYLTASEIIIRSRQLEHQVARFPVMLVERWEKWAEKDIEAEEFDPFERTGEDYEPESDLNGEETETETEAELEEETETADDDDDDEDEDDAISLDSSISN